jgi:hypothetical protein
MAPPKNVPPPAPAGAKSDCPREAASGTFTAEFGTNQKGAAAAAKWLRETRAWINDTFDNMCEHDSDCSKTLIVIKVSSTINPLTKNMTYTMTFTVTCHRTTQGEV